MNERCTACDQNFEPEPGFYYGAMFLSYIMTAFIFLGIGLITVFYCGWSPEKAMILIIGIAIVLHNWFWRVSRSLWIHMVVRPRTDKT